MVALSGACGASGRMAVVKRTAMTRIVIDLRI